MSAWNPPPRKMEGGGQFYQALGALNFHLPLGGSPSPTGQKLTHPSPTRKSPPEDSAPNFYYPPPNVHPPTK